MSAIEGIPEGWELVRIGVPSIGDWVVTSEGKVLKWNHRTIMNGFAIIRKIEKPKQYRPFANAKEAEPFFDRKLKYKQHDESVLRICFLSNKGVHVSKYDYPYEEAFDVLECMDGTPFGVEVTE